MSCSWYEFRWPSLEGHIVMGHNIRLRCLLPIVIISFRFWRPCTDIIAVIISPRLVALYRGLLGFNQKFVLQSDVYFMAAMK